MSKQIKRFKKGQLFRWVADRHFRAWDTFGICVNVSKGRATVITFDDFKDTEIDADQSESREISAVTVGEMNQYFLERRNGIEKQKLDLNLKIKNLDLAAKQIDDWETKILESTLNGTKA